MAYKVACCFIKGDWAEFAHTLGLPNWRDGYRPCFSCCGYGSDLFVAAGNSRKRLRWAINTAAAWEAACQRCGIHVRIVSVATRNLIWNLLQYDRRPDKAHGLALTADLPELGLRIGDRLEASSSLLDVGCFSEAAVPIDIDFW